jgi:hypothetical protein
VATRLSHQDDGVWMLDQSGPIAFPHDGNARNADVEADSFWFAHRQRCLIAAMRAFDPGPVFVDIGGGTGFVSAAVKRQLARHVVLIEPDPAGARHHALRTFVSGCAREKGREPPKANAVLDCALSEEMPEPAWLELSRRTLQWRGSPPSSFALGNRLLLSLGPPPPSVVGFLANPAATGTKLWPLKAADPRAIAASLQALSAAQKTALDAPETTLEALFQILAA